MTAAKPLRVTCDTTVVIDALDGTRPAASELFSLARAGELDVAFSTRLEHELQRHTLADVQALVARATPALGTTARYGFSTYGGGDRYAVPESVSLPTLQRVGKLDALDSDHLEAHRASGRAVFVTSDGRLLKAARGRGIDANTPEELLERIRLLARWRADYDQVRSDVADLMVQRHFYRELRSILEAGRERFEEMDGTLFRWIDKLHAHSAAVAVRKQVDPSSDSVCLRQLLQAIAPAAHLITRAAFVARAGSAPDGDDERVRWEFEERQRWLDERFDELVGRGAPHLTETVVRADLARLNDAAAQVRRFASKTIAHRDRKGIGIEATWEDLNGAIDTVEDLMQRYNELLDAGHARQLVPTYQYDWKAPLRVPWLLDDRTRKLARTIAEGNA